MMTPAVPSPEAGERSNGVAILAPRESPDFHESESK